MGIYRTLKKLWWKRDASDRRVSSSILNPPSMPTDNQLFWFEFLGMFIFVYLQTCTNKAIGIHLQITFTLLITIPLCIKQSGAHYNPAVTLSNALCKFNVQQITATWFMTYFKAQLLGALLAYTAAYFLNDGFYAQLVPNHSTPHYQIFLSEFVGTFTLVFFIQLLSNSQTTFTDNPLITYFFIVSCVFVARKFATVSFYAINPAISLAQAIVGVFLCDFHGIHSYSIFLGGDLLGSVAGTCFYNKFYEPVLQLSRSELSQKSEHESEPLISKEGSQISEEEQNT